MLEEIITFCKTHQIAHPQIIGASKKQTAQAISLAYQAGLKHFGENYVQEAVGKSKKDAYHNATLHMIGHLQSNKAREAVKLFDTFHGLDSPKLANTLQKACMKEKKKIDVFIQVNLAEEMQKGGCLTEDLDNLVNHTITSCPNLNLIGLMTLPPTEKDPIPYFKKLASLGQAHKLPDLSMGMSKDWREALLCGATHIRLGTALFGERPTK